MDFFTTELEHVLSSIATKIEEILDFIHFCVRCYLTCEEEI
jgi:hypothetical protein